MVMLVNVGVIRHGTLIPNIKYNVQIIYFDDFTIKLCYYEKKKKSNLYFNWSYIQINIFLIQLSQEILFDILKKKKKNFKDHMTVIWKCFSLQTLMRSGHESCS